MVAEDVERLERQLRGETAKWVLLSVSNNCLYDHGVCKLVEVLQKTTAPLETLDLSRTSMSCVGAKKLATLLSADGDAPLLPLRKLLLHGNAIGADGYAEVGAAIRHPRCSLEEFVVSTQMRERKTGQNRVSRTEEPNVVVVREIKSLVELRTDFLGDAELVIISEVLALNTALRTIELRKNRVGDDGIEALARAIGRGGLPIRVLLLEGNHVSAKGATALAEGLLQGKCPLEELGLSDNAITSSAESVRHRKADGEFEAELKKAAAATRASPASEWARAQLQVREAAADRRAREVAPTELTAADFKAVLALPKELREDRWERRWAGCAAPTSPPPPPRRPPRRRAPARRPPRRRRRRLRRRSSWRGSTTTS